MLSTVRQLEGDDKVINNLGEHPKGIMIITPDYRFIIIETGDGRKAASTTEEFAALQKSELAYSGLVTFSPDPSNSQGVEDDQQSRHRVERRMDRYWPDALPVARRQQAHDPHTSVEKSDQRRNGHIDAGVRAVEVIYRPDP